MSDLSALHNLAQDELVLCATCNKIHKRSRNCIQPITTNSDYAAKQAIMRDSQVSPELKEKVSDRIAEFDANHRTQAPAKPTSKLSASEVEIITRSAENMIALRTAKSPIVKMQIQEIDSLIYEWERDIEATKIKSMVAHSKRNKLMQMLDAEQATKCATTQTNSLEEHRIKVAKQFQSMVTQYMKYDKSITREIAEKLANQIQKDMGVK